MEKNIRNIVLLSILLLVSIFAISGGTFAFFRASSNSNVNDISGKTRTLDVSVNVNSIKTGNLIPVADNLIITSLNGNYPCVDTRGYSLCSIYEITLVNTGVVANLEAYVISNNGTTYTTNNLKYQLFTYNDNNSTYTSVSDMGNINITNGTKNYIKSGLNNISLVLNDGTLSSYTREYRLVVWLSDPGDTNQLDDVNKVLNASIVFELANGNAITATFTS